LEGTFGVNFPCKFQLDRAIKSNSTWFLAKPWQNKYIFLLPSPTSSSALSQLDELKAQEGLTEHMIGLLNQKEELSLT